jgi:hypothetical protein
MPRRQLIRCGMIRPALGPVNEISRRRSRIRWFLLSWPYEKDAYFAAAWPVSRHGYCGR